MTYTPSVPREVVISVDLATTGPVLGTHEVIAIGACVVGYPKTYFEIISPTNSSYIPSTIDSHGITVERAKKEGGPRDRVVASFSRWVDGVAEVLRPVMLSYNTSVNFQVITELFRKSLHRCPFGTAGIDIRQAYYFITGEPWNRSFKSQAKKLLNGLGKTVVMATDDQHPLSQAMENAEVYYKLCQVQAERNLALKEARDLLLVRSWEDPALKKFVATKFNNLFIKEAQEGH